jgi:hypothetical protein
MPSALLALLSTVAISATPPLSDAIVPVRAQGETFVGPDGKEVRFWGVNLVSLFPTHEEAEKVAANLAERGINLVRPHHLLRPSSDWNWRSGVLGLNRLKENTRDPDPEAWDRFDYLNAQLRKQGIYLSLSLHFSRSFLPGDADALQTTPADREAWVAAITELRSWDWRKSMDPAKMLPTIDARAAALQEEFARQLLEHVNPYTGLSYGRDPQVVTIEVVNESSAEYCLICGNTFPKYFLDALETKWSAFLADHGVGDFRHQAASTAEEKNLRTQFYRSLDEALMMRMAAVVRGLGCNAAFTYSNLWRGESNLSLHREHADFVEDHTYMDPLVVRDAADGFLQHSRTLLRGKPYMLGEVNQAEGEQNVRDQAPMRTMLPLAMASYGLFHGYAGITWFAWCHGDRAVASDGWALREGRDAQLGDMVADGMMLDHLRTCGLIFRHGLVAPSATPQTLYVDEPFVASDYQTLMRGKYTIQPGWQAIHSIRKAFGPVPAEQAASEWLTQQPVSPYVSDTGEIVKDTVRRQLTVTAPQAEAFSGFLDGTAPAGPKHLLVDGTNGFATVAAVCMDGQPFGSTKSILLSRTCVGPDGRDRVGPIIALRGLLPARDGAGWSMRLTRPRDANALLAAFSGQETWPSTAAADGRIVLPAADWHECELAYADAH